MKYLSLQGAIGLSVAEKLFNYKGKCVLNHCKGRVFTAIGSIYSLQGTVSVAGKLFNCKRTVSLVREQC